jgi:hypothetical protein
MNKYSFHYPKRGTYSYVQSYAFRAAPLYTRLDALDPAHRCDPDTMRVLGQWLQPPQPDQIDAGSTQFFLTFLVVCSDNCIATNKLTHNTPINWSNPSMLSSAVSIALTFVARYLSPPDGASIAYTFPRLI